MELAVEIVRLLTALAGLTMAMAAAVRDVRSWLRRKKEDGQKQ